MNNEILDSIVELTNSTDSDQFSYSILATLAQLVPNASIALFQYSTTLYEHEKQVITLKTNVLNDGKTDFTWGENVDKATLTCVREHASMQKEPIQYRCKHNRHHLFVPIFINQKLAYVIDVSILSNIALYRDTIVAISKVCQNFYAILACSETDTLTGLNNRRTYDNRLSLMLEEQHKSHKNNMQNNRGVRQINEHQQSWLAVVDIDFFKRVNDKYGHIYGDEVLLVLAQLMNECFRGNDLLFRFGGEEFVIIFEPISKQGAESILEKFRLNVASHEFPMVGSISISCGYAQISKHDHPKSVFDRADKALYYAKEHGRNQIQNYEHLVEIGEISNFVEEGDIDLF
ncbi:GGDEF domain-containing protein [Thalassotalea sediminis]|uniref:GGDEF domain-containing protein n=1 Tax=Thalassotalea sediminis TaxID=1759089 RepID=UPI002573B19C|nr:GGDEF domain-containing protein [Thalassotalea sediminis]